MLSILTDHFALSTLLSSVAREPRPFIVPRTPEGEQILHRLANGAHDLHNWSGAIHTKLETHQIKVTTLYSPNKEGEAIALPCLRLYYNPEKQSYAAWLADVEDLAKKLQGQHQTPDQIT